MKRQLSPAKIEKGVNATLAQGDKWNAEALTQFQPWSVQTAQTLLSVYRPEMGWIDGAWQDGGKCRSSLLVMGPVQAKRPT